MKTKRMTKKQMKKLQFKVSIDAPVDKIFDCMLGLSSKSTY